MYATEAPSIQNREKDQVSFLYAPIRGSQKCTGTKSMSRGRLGHGSSVDTDRGLGYSRDWGRGLVNTQEVEASLPHPEGGMFSFRCLFLLYIFDVFFCAFTNRGAFIQAIQIQLFS